MGRAEVTRELQCNLISYIPYPSAYIKVLSYMLITIELLAQHKTQTLSNEHKPTLTTQTALANTTSCVLEIAIIFMRLTTTYYTLLP